MCVKTPLLQSIKEMPICNQFIKETCMKRLGRKNIEPPTINIIGRLDDLLLDKVLHPRYVDSRSHVVDVRINKTPIPNTVIDLGVVINVMKRDTILKLNLQM